MIPKFFGYDNQEVKQTLVMTLGHYWSFRSEPEESPKQHPMYINE